MSSYVTYRVILFDVHLAMPKHVVVPYENQMQRRDFFLPTAQHRYF